MVRRRACSTWVVLPAGRPRRLAGAGADGAAGGLARPSIHSITESLLNLTARAPGIFRGGGRRPGALVMSDLTDATDFFKRSAKSWIVKIRGT